MPGWASAAKYWNYSIPLRKRVKEPPSPDVQNYAGKACQSLANAAKLDPVGSCVTMYRVLSLIHRS
jgi:hypothetical protein